VRVLVAGATGAIGQRLVPQLIAKGHDVYASGRTPDKLDKLERLGANPVLMDGLDRAMVREAVAGTEPHAIVHQMTALSGKADLRHFDRWFATTNELRTEGTDNLLAAAQAVGVDRFIAQSYTGWTNQRTGSAAKSEDDPMDADPLKEQSRSLEAIRYLEKRVTEAPLDGIVLRYGNFYGPMASDSMIELIRKRRFPVIGNGEGVWSWIHLDDAAAATVAAIERGKPGIYNIADDDPAPVSDWLPYLAEIVGAKPPMTVPQGLARVVAGRVPDRWMTEGRGVSNARAKRELEWQPKWPSWREGFRDAFANHAFA
jgi:2-alkyl-3-oxoalkanoate reductase